MMKLPVAFSILMCTACAHAGSSFLETEREQLQERQNTFLVALAEGDPEEATAHFAEDAALHIADLPPITGRTAIREFYGNVFRFMTASRASPETLRMSSSADMAFSTGSVANTFQGEDGPVEYAGKYLLVWENRDDDWSIVVYSVSNDRSDEGR